MNLNLNLYRYFFVVAKNLSYTKAAEELLVSQPSLSYGVKVLENQIDKKLFNRTSKGIELTEDGKELYEKLDQVFEILGEDDNSNDLKGKITIGTRSLIAMYILPRYFNAFSKLYPDITIEFRLRSSIELQNGIRNGDFSIIIDELGQSDDKINDYLLKEKGLPSIFITSTKNDDIFIDEKYLKNNEILISPINEYSKNLLKKFQFIKTEEVISTPALVSKIIKDNKVGYSNQIVIQNEINNGLIKICETNLELPISNLHISSKKSINNCEKAFIDMMLNYDFKEIDEI